MLRVDRRRAKHLNRPNVVDRGQPSEAIRDVESDRIGLTEESRG